MTMEEAGRFVHAFAASWAAPDGAEMRALWHPDGWLFTPLVDRPVAGSEIERLVALQRRISPDLRWSLLEWALSAEAVYIEWKTEQTVAGVPFAWRGMDKFVLEGGLIREERVFADTATLRAMRLQATMDKAATAARLGISPDTFMLRCSEM